MRVNLQCRFYVDKKEQHCWDTLDPEPKNPFVLCMLHISCFFVLFCYHSCYLLLFLLLVIVFVVVVVMVVAVVEMGDELFYDSLWH